VVGDGRSHGEIVRVPIGLDRRTGAIVCVQVHRLGLRAVPSSVVERSKPISLSIRW
jgi:hypothetical protein